MKRRLYIAEKPRVGRELAACLPSPHRRHADYIETAGGVVTWAYGHILTQWEPSRYDDRYRRWTAEDLPIVPPEWRLEVAKDARSQFARIRELLAAADEVVHAGDPDREGQLLIDEILDYLGNTKPVYRILINALDEKSIHAALADLRPNTDFAPLRDSALARSRADWLMGMNLSRAYTLRVRRQGNPKVVLPIGRVKTPTLALVVRREREIVDFTPEEYYVVHARFAAAEGELTVKWKPGPDQVGVDSENRLRQKYIAQDLAERLAAAPTGVISAHSKRKKKENAPLPLSLSALQVLAGKRYGYEPDAVLAAAQALYERKWTTYPRSDCDYLPTNQWTDRQTILGHLAQAPAPLGPMVEGADASRKSRAWNDEKITAHHAIIPTTVPCPLASLSPVQRDVYILIARAYIAQFYPAYVYEQTKIEVTAADEIFTASGRVECDAGWRVLYRQEKQEPVDGEEETESVFPPLAKGDTVQYRELKTDEKMTKPPTRFTASTLLEAMKGIHRYVRDERLKQQLRAVAGIGTEATRATIIAELTARKLMTAKGKKKYLYPTETAYLLIDALPAALTYPDETAKWEERLSLIGTGEDTLAAFLRDQTEYVTDLVTMANDDLAHVETVACPKCGQPLRLRTGKYGVFCGCSGYPDCRYTRPLTGTDADTVEKKDAPPPADAPRSEVVCPRCRRGVFVRRGREWACEHYPDCRTIAADCDGRPAIGRP